MLNEATDTRSRSSSNGTARSAIAPRLKKGANQVDVKVKENYGGWAAAADPAALSGPALAAEGR